MEPYIKRCTATKVVSAEKLMYICKNQLGVEKEYEEKVMPDGRLNIDGFIIAFDVSPARNRSIEKQIEFANAVITTILKNKKSVILATTKTDDANDIFIREAEKICQKKEYKGLVQLVETSAHDLVNVDQAFIILAQTVDKVKNKLKVFPYHEAAKCRKELFHYRAESVKKLIHNTITDYHTLWPQGSKILSQYKDWNEFLNTFGRSSSEKIFTHHMKKLRDEHFNKRLCQMLDKFSAALEEMLPDFNVLETSPKEEWHACKKYLMEHPLYEKYFVAPSQLSWKEFNYDETNSKIPFDVLDTSDAEAVYKDFVSTMRRNEQKNRWKKLFKALLEDSNYVTPGKELSEVKVLFMGRECFEALSEKERVQIYDAHQYDIIKQCRNNFVEMLLENSKFFSRFKTADAISSEDYEYLIEIMRDDPRYKMLDRLDGERKDIILRYLEFLHNPEEQLCLFNDLCIDNIRNKIFLEEKLKQRNGGGCVNNINLLIMGSEHLASDLLNDIRICTGPDGQYICDNKAYYFNFSIANGNIDNSVDMNSSGLLCVYSNQQSFEILKQHLEKTLIRNFELEETFESLPIVLVFQPHDIKEGEYKYLQAEGARLAAIMHCEFIENRNELQQKYVDNVLNIIILSLQLSRVKPLDSHASPIEMRILVCMFCGDEYDIRNIIKPFINNATKFNDSSISTFIFIEEKKRHLQFIFTSYHKVFQYCNEEIHGFVYIYSANRRSSLSNMSTLVSQFSSIPTQIVAVTTNKGASAFFENEIYQHLITEGCTLADACNGNFMIVSPEKILKLSFFIPFFRSAWSRQYFSKMSQNGQSEKYSLYLQPKYNFLRSYNMDDLGSERDSGEIPSGFSSDNLSG